MEFILYKYLQTLRNTTYNNGKKEGGGETTVAGNILHCIKMNEKDRENVQWRLLEPQNTSDNTRFGWWVAGGMWVGVSNFVLRTTYGSQKI